MESEVLQLVWHLHFNSAKQQPVSRLRRCCCECTAGEGGGKRLGVVRVNRPVCITEKASAELGRMYTWSRTLFFLFFFFLLENHSCHLETTCSANKNILGWRSSPRNVPSAGWWGREGGYAGAPCCCCGPSCCCCCLWVWLLGWLGFCSWLSRWSRSDSSTGVSSDTCSSE
jgi:hypothetical protein